MSLGGCIRAWLILWVMEILLTLAFVPLAQLHALIGSEIAASRARWGAAGPQRVVGAAHNPVESLLEALPFRAERRREAVEDEFPAAPAERGVTIVMGRLRSLYILALYRLGGMREAALPVLAGIVAAAIDGLTVRRRRAYSFATTNTAAYNAAAYGVLSLLMVPLWYLVAPLALPTALLPTAALLAAGAVWVLFAHLPGAGPLVGLRT